MGLPLVGLGRQPHQLLLIEIALVDHRADLGFEPAHLGVDVEVRALRGRHCIGCGIPGLAQFFEPGFDRTQIGGLRFERDLGLLDLARHLLALGLGFALAQQPQQFELLVAVGLQAFVAFGHDRPSGYFERLS